MKKVALVALAMAVSAFAASSARAAEASAGVDLASAYVFRGETFNDGLVAQPYLEVSGLPIDLGVWANFDIDDYDGTINDGQFSEIDLYASYSVPVDAVDLSIGYTEYTYPGAEGDADRELGIGLGLDLPLAPAVGVYYGLDGGIDSDLYVDFGIGQDFELADGVGLSLGALVGYLSPDEGEDGFKQYELSASLSYDFISAGVTYVGQLDDEVLVDVEDGGKYDADVVGVIGVGFDF
jgi:uncharacterized protein (TIGR02001 family)